MSTKTPARPGSQETCSPWTPPYTPSTIKPTYLPIAFPSLPHRCTRTFTMSLHHPLPINFPKSHSHSLPSTTILTHCQFSSPPPGYPLSSSHRHISPPRFRSPPPHFHSPPTHPSTTTHSPYHPHHNPTPNPSSSPTLSPPSPHFISLFIPAVEPSHQKNKIPK